MPPRFNSVVLDVDSTLCDLEGIDWLARQRGPEVARRIAEVTDRAMNGEIALESVYGARLEIVEPDAVLLERLGAAYVERLLPGAVEAVHTLRGAGVEVAVVSGGIRAAILPAVERLGLPAERLRAVDVYLDDAGRYAGYDAASPLTTDTGKAEVIRQFRLPSPCLMLGDGNTDLAARPAVDAFAAFVGVVRRDIVVAQADHVVASFEQLTSLVLQ